MWKLLWISSLFYIFQAAKREFLLCEVFLLNSKKSCILVSSMVRRMPEVVLKVTLLYAVDYF